jgi:hypothetical protein
MWSWGLVLCASALAAPLLNDAMKTGQVIGLKPRPAPGKPPLSPKEEVKGWIEMQAKEYGHAQDNIVEPEKHVAASHDKAALHAKGDGSYETKLALPSKMADKLSQSSDYKATSTPQSLVMSQTTAASYSFEGRTSCVRNSQNQLLIAVVSSPKHHVARDAVRQTWLRDAHARGIPVKFFVGQLSDEDRGQETGIMEERDVVRFSDYTENYNNLSSKAIDIFSYAARNCFDGVFKADDDTYVRVPRLLDFLAENRDWSSLYAGKFIDNAPVMKNPEGRWYAYDQYPHDTFPKFANGPGMFLGSRGIRYIDEHRDQLARLRTDDSAVAIWTEGLGLDKVDMPASFFEYEPKKSAVFQNPLEPDEMIKLHRGETFTARACQPETKFSCRCSDSPYNSNDDIAACWEVIGNTTKYSDDTRRASV